MNPLDSTPTAPRLEQVYLIERDAGLLCRILGLYAARGVDVLHADYGYAARDVMKLRVCVDASRPEAGELVRVLVDKASTFIGVLAASEQFAAGPSAAGARARRTRREGAGPDAGGPPGPRDALMPAAATDA